MSTDCSYCGSDVELHAPVYTEEVVDGERKRAGQFCNYACLRAHIEERGLTAGACCTLDF